jgi:hypothetical protein
VNRANSQHLAAHSAIGMSSVYRPELKDQANACGGSAPKLHYLGGPVIQNPNIVSVLWTANVDPNVVSQIGKFYTDLLASSYLDLLGEYSTAGVAPEDGQPGTTQAISRGKYVGQFTITPSVCATGAACTLTDDQVQAELASQIAAGHLPAVTKGCDGQVSSLYMIDFPANVTITFLSGTTTQTSCVQFCGYHSAAPIGGLYVPYAVLPDLETGPCQSTCSTTGHASFIDETSVRTHEIAESMTDAQPSSSATEPYARPAAWADEVCGEVGDICNFQEASVSLNGTTWTVQQLWSNRVGNCTVTGSPPPVCTGASTPAGCRACGCADENYAGTTTQLGCGGAAPSCETTTANAKVGQCVQCTASEGCTAKEICQQSTTVASDDVCEACGAIGQLCCASSSCAAPGTCSTTGASANHCVCQPLTACPAGATCGIIPDGCGGTVDCGGAPCESPQTCGGGGTPNQCGCSPLKACSAGQSCGSVPDGCGGMVSCGTCEAGQTCESNRCTGASTGAGSSGSATGSDGGPGDPDVPDPFNAPASCGCRVAGSGPNGLAPAWLGLGALLTLRACRRRRASAARGSSLRG